VAERAQVRSIADVYAALMRRRMSPVHVDMDLVSVAYERGYWDGRQAAGDEELARIREERTND
jgi:hypothetical protein